jgi:nucleoside-diphosphate-sugar epimerase
MAMRLLVTGATGFIGRHLVRRLAQRHEVHALVREASRLDPAATAVVVDLAQPLDVEALPASVDVIIHLAQANVPFPSGAHQLFAVNTAATAELLEYGRTAGARQFVLASSGDVYGARPTPCRETDPVAPQGFYAATKHASELLLQAYEAFLAPCTLRLFHPYGPGANRLIARLADRIARGEPVALNRHDQPRITPTHIDDVIGAFERVIDSSYGGVMNVCGAEVVSIRELGDAIGAVLGRQPVYEASEREAGDVIGDNARMRQELGLTSLTSLRDGLTRTFAGARRPDDGGSR